MTHPLASALAANEIYLFTVAGELRYRCPPGKMTPEIQAAIAEQKAEITAALNAEVESHQGRRSADETIGQGTPPWSGRSSARDWPDADTAAAADFTLLLTPADLPATPFRLGGPWCVIDNHANRAKFLASLQSDVRAGPHGPRAKTGALAADLRVLRTMLLDDADTDTAGGANETDGHAEPASNSAATDLHPGGPW